MVNLDLSGYYLKFSSALNLEKNQIYSDDWWGAEEDGGENGPGPWRTF